MHPIQILLVKTRLMNKRIPAFSLIFILFSLSSLAQDANNNHKIMGLDTTGLEAKLIRIALKRPNYDITYHQILNAQHELSKARNSWLNLLTISLNYNQFDFTAPPNAAYVYPKYFFGLTIPLGYIFSRGSDMKIARENEVIAKDNQQELARTIVASVKTKYLTYLNYQSLLAVQNTIVNDEQAVFLQEEKNFRDGKVSIETYNNASKVYNSSIIQQLQYKLLSDQTKIDLEKDLGMTLEEAINK